MSTLEPGIEPSTKAFLDKVNSSTGPQLYELKVEDARKVFNDLQNVKVTKLPADIQEQTIPGPKGDVKIRIVRPPNVKEALPAVIYVHGAGWVLGGWESHDRLVLELANKANVAVVFVEFSLSPEAQYPVAVEECYAAAKYVAEHARELNIDGSRMAVAGDSVGGNMAIAVTMLAKERGGPRIDFQLLFYPVGAATFDTPSYKQFGTNHFLTLEAMKWFWNQYAPDVAKRKEPTASPLEATTEQLKGLPPALVITAEFDVLRDEGEAYAHKLSAAGVRVSAVRCLGTIHDFVLLNAITDTPAPRLAIALATATLKEHMHPAVAAAGASRT